ncbi:MAG TPA: response regulator [Kofleriaceae bacterium]|nr:response regulator [Kofleriaceae bacterium]
MRALIVEDYESDAKLLIHELRRGGRNVDAEVVATAAAARAALTERSWDVILTDWAVPGFGALPLLALVHELGLDIPVIIVSGTMTEDFAVSAMRGGARDFVLKERLLRLIPAVEREVHEAETRAARRRAEDELRASAVRYRELFESTPLPMWVYDVDTLRFLMVNNAAVRRYGYTREEFSGLTLADIRPPEDHDQLLDDVARREDTPRVWRHLAKDGELLSVEVTAHDLEFEGKRARLVLANDITARLQLEEQLRQSQKMEAVGRLAGGVAHDFNNILCVINSYSETLLAALPAGDLRDDADQIRTAGQRGAALTRQLLMFTRQQIVEPRVLDLNTVLTDMGKMLQRLLGADVELVWRTTSELPPVRADQSSLEQVIMNLVVNARDAMPRGGKLTLRTASVDLDAAYARHYLGAAPGRYVLLAVSDTGVGMDRATQARIFEPFFTTKERGRGTGLGLSTVFGIVQQNHGHMVVSSEPGKGTTFRIYLPEAPAAAEPAPPPEPTAVMKGSETILLVEDDLQVRAVALTILRKFGYLVLAAQDADEAQRACENHPHPIHLLLTDAAVPGSTGTELAQRLRRIRPELCVLCLAGHEEASNGAVVSEAIAQLRKPFTADALARSVRRVLDGAAKRAG